MQPKPRRGQGPGPGGASGSAPGDRPAPEVINDPTTDLPPIDPTNYGRNLGMAGYYGGANERNTYRPPIEMQTNALLGGQWLKIRQTDSEMSIVNAATSRNYTPGQHSVVSVTTGVADQESGWSGKEYLIYLKPQIGPSVKETYSLTPDGRQLLVTIDIGSEGKNPAIKVKRTYDRSTRDPDSFKQNLQVTLPPTD